MVDELETRLFNEIASIRLIDTHSHIDPLTPGSHSLDDILSYHYFTELAHSVGMPQDSLRPDFDPRERCRTIISYLDRFDNTAAADWLLDIAQTYLGFQGERITIDDTDQLFDASLQVMSTRDWEEMVLRSANVDTVFLTNPFDDPLTGFDRKRYVPCLRTDDLVFRINDGDVRNRLAIATGITVGDTKSLRSALRQVFARFVAAGCRACAVSLPPSFEALPIANGELELDRLLSNANGDVVLSQMVFWLIAELCREFDLPFDLMIGVNRDVYHNGVFQGKDLFDQRTSLMQYAPLFNAFPEVPFCVSVLSSWQNQELVSFSWIFPNVHPHGHWWYSNTPTYIESDLRARLGAVPRFKILGYYSDAYKLEFVRPKFRMYFKKLSRILADDFVRPGKLDEEGALAFARQILQENPKRIFKV